MVEFRVVWEILKEQVRYSQFGCFEDIVRTQEVEYLLADFLWVTVKSVPEYELAIVLEVAHVSVHVTELNVHDDALPRQIFSHGEILGIPGPARIFPEDILLYRHNREKYDKNMDLTYSFAFA